MTDSNFETLITRYVDQTATPEDLAQLTQLAQSDASIWPRLQAAVNDHAALVSAIEKRTRSVEAIDLPDLQSADFESIPIAHQDSPFSAWSRWSGWGVAAAVALMWVGLSQFAPGTGTPGNNTTASIQSANWTATDALNRYVEAGRAEGRILQELPKVLIRTQPTSDGNDTEVVFLRQFVERTTPSRFYGIQRDESDTPRVVPVQWAKSSAGELY